MFHHNHNHNNILNCNKKNEQGIAHEPYDKAYARIL